MVHVIADRVRDTSATTGTGNFTVANSPPTGYETLDTVLATSDLFDYLIQHQTANEWETGIGTYNGSHVFVRTTVRQSSNADAAVNFSAGTKDVVLVLSADRIKNPRVPDGSAISDDSANEILRFQKTASAVNQVDITNAATGSPPAIEATGDDTNIDLLLGGKGTGTPVVPNAGIALRDSDSSHKVTIKTTSNLTANRTLTLLIDDADRTVNFDDWVTWAPTISSVGGTITAHTVNAALYCQIGKTILFQLDVTITTVGTATGAFQWTHPVTAAAGLPAFCGIEAALTGVALVAFGNSTTVGRALEYDGTTALATGARIIVSGAYAAA